MTAQVPTRRHVIRRRRRRALAVAASVLTIAGWGLVHLTMPQWYARHWYPLEYADVISRHAELRGVPADLVAAVVRRESNFRPAARSEQGAVGLMQILPSTAQWIATQPGGRDLAPERLVDPDENIAFGTWYLQYLRAKYRDERIVLAAYNAGETYAADWSRQAVRERRPFALDEIPFPETREFVRQVRATRDVYRRVYARELGID